MHNMRRIVPIAENWAIALPLLSLILPLRCTGLKSSAPPGQVEIARCSRRDLRWYRLRELKRPKYIRLLNSDWNSHYRRWRRALRQVHISYDIDAGENGRPPKPAHLSALAVYDRGSPLRASDQRYQAFKE